MKQDLEQLFQHFLLLLEMAMLRLDVDVRN